MVKLSPSILAADFSNLSKIVKQCKEGGASMLHIDVMDGHFVPNISMGPMVVKGIRSITKKKLDVHLMIENPERYINSFAKSGADIITVHIETCKNADSVINQIKDEGLSPGITLRPDTPLERIEDYLEYVDLILVMSVEPGFGGQTFLPHMMSRISEVKKLVQGLDNNRPEISVDGDVKLDNAKEVLAAGANILVSGTGIFGTSNPVETMRKFLSYG
ncbi:MAG: ribulose-phosphate 3-epimerase [Candidatus Marinimicrobia bacterium]|nr:ribulose-phosphate 3-epimerase [Candidatus Neomarinimicrobiota bacterium]|tara:strand:+ start:2638 stop:3291 length:654 start_codon:yes stop_codon:yes gene_type:complete